MTTQPTLLFKMRTKHGPDSSPECQFITLHAAACSCHKMRSFESSCICIERWRHLLPVWLLRTGFHPAFLKAFTFSWEGYGNFCQHTACMAVAWLGSESLMHLGFCAKSFKSETFVFCSSAVSSWALNCCPSEAGTAFAAYKSIFKLCFWHVLSGFQVS